MKIYIIAGEASGDIYGARLMEALRRLSPEPVEFYGVGGDKMAATGLSSLFPMAEISIMGFLEIIPHIPNVLKRIRQTVEDIKTIRPDVVITIDSPGFCCRVAKQLRKENISSKLIHYVAPTVWAYKPKRAEKFARLFDHLLVILPFEPPYFEAVGLPCTYIGHPITENVIETGKAMAFWHKHNISPNDTLICMMPGSRAMEVVRMLPIFLKATQLLTCAPNLKLVIPTIPAVKGLVQKFTGLSGIHVIILDEEAEKYEAYAASTAAIVKSGTGSLEVAMADCPMVIAYKVSKISYHLIKFMIKIKYANLINIILNKELIPEFIQNNCQPYLIAQSLDGLLRNEDLRQQQISESKAVLHNLGYGQSTTPSYKAAKAVLALIAK
jgi:lipid-A-disaccharide synthase